MYANVPTNAELAPMIERILSRAKSAWNARFSFDIPTHSYMVLTQRSAKYAAHRKTFRSERASSPRLTVTSISNHEQQVAVFAKKVSLRL